MFADAGKTAAGFTLIVFVAVVGITLLTVIFFCGVFSIL